MMISQREEADISYSYLEYNKIILLLISIISFFFFISLCHIGAEWFNIVKILLSLNFSSLSLVIRECHWVTYCLANHNLISSICIRLVSPLLISYN